MTEYIVKNRETNGVLAIGTETDCKEQASHMNTRYQTDAFYVEEFDLNKKNLARVRFSAATDSWVATDGSKVCQDHATLMPCPYPHGKAKK